jgi:hypothetical protein
MAPQMIPGPLTYDDGLSSNGQREWFKNLPLDAAINPDFLYIMQDFNDKSKVIDTTNDYTTIFTSTGTATIQVSGSHLKLLSAATTVNDGGVICTAGQPILLQANKKCWFEARVQGSSVADMELFVGLSKVAAATPQSILAANFSRVGFELRGSTAVVKASMGSGSSDTISSTGVSMADNTFIKLGFYFDGQNIQFFVDRNKKLTSVLSGVGPVLGTDQLGLSFEERSISAAGTRSALLDYWFCVAER